MTDVTLNAQKFITETLGEQAWQVYNSQCNLNNQFAYDFHNAYAYGGPDEPGRVHERIAQIGAKNLEIPVEEYLTIHQNCVDSILALWDVPEQFRNEEYFE